ncbi:MAG: hypothetical protein HY916_03510 [Desulfovibrio sp.]|jgi:hypothetical protein|nr:hypothetical protein [Desulfovibrio sp.]
MDRELLLLCLPLASFVAATASQALFYRLKPSLSLSYLAALFGGLACLAALTALLPPADVAAAPGEDIAYTLANLGIYLGLWLCFVAVVGLSISLRIRIMAFLKDSGRPRTEADIEAAFQSELLVSQRIDRLIAGGHLRRENGRLYSCGTWLTKVARFNALVKRFLTGQVSEFHGGG